MREIVLDTETTGLDAAVDRVIEIGALELNNHVPTGRRLHLYINPEQPVSADAVAVHGLTDAFLADKPVFAEIVGEVMDFLGEAVIVAHNASFDLGMLNAELARLGFRAIEATRAVDTAAMARRKFPGAPASLDALCRRFEVDNSSRTLHGALLDAELLAEVYLHLKGGRQTSLILGADDAPGPGAGAAALARPDLRPDRAPRAHPPLEAAERDAHAALLDRLKDPIWRRQHEGGPA